MSGIRGIKLSVVAGFIILITLCTLAVSRGDTLDQVTILEETEHSVLVRVGSSSGRFLKEFSFDFEGESFNNWFSNEGWKSMMLQSPSAKTPEAYTALSHAIILGNAGFVDNRISVERENPANGSGAIRFEAVNPSSEMVTSKTLIERSQMWFANGDDLWFYGAFFLESGVPYSIVDFEDNNMRGNPGPRIVIDSQRFIGIELKSGNKPRLRQDQVEVPLRQWFDLVVHLSLSETAGQVQIWQDQVLIIDGEMQTLPNAGALLSTFQIGITATDSAAVLLMDDVSLGHSRR